MESRRFEVYGRFYGGLAPAFVALSFLPALEPVAEYGSLWHMTRLPNSGRAYLAIAALVALIGFLLAGAFRPDARAVPAGVAVTAAALTVLVLTRGGMPPPRPGLAEAGMAGAVLAFTTAGISTVHMWHSAVVRQRSTKPVQDGQ